MVVLKTSGVCVSEDDGKGKVDEGRTDVWMSIYYSTTSDGPRGRRRV